MRAPFYMVKHARCHTKKSLDSPIPLCYTTCSREGLEGIYVAGIWDSNLKRLVGGDPIAMGDSYE